MVQYRSFPVVGRCGARTGLAGMGVLGSMFVGGAVSGWWGCIEVQKAVASNGVRDVMEGKA